MRALFDLQPRPVDSDYELAFRRAEGSKRALVVVFCDLLEEAAARPLVRAVPVLSRRHAVIVASPSDPALGAPSPRAGGAPTPSPPRARRSPATSSPPVPAPPRRSAPPARGCSRRRPTSSRRVLVAAYLRAKSRAVL